MTSQQRVFKINKVSFQVIQFFIKVSLRNFLQNLTSKSRVIHVRISISKQNQIMTKAKVKFIKTKAIFTSHTRGVSNEVLSNQDQKIKSYSCSKWEKAGKPVPKWEKRKSRKKHFWVTKQGNKGFTNRGRFQGLQTVVRGITNRVNFRDFRSGQGFQFGAKIFQIGAEIRNRCERDFKLGQGLQIGAKQPSARDVL